MATPGFQTDSLRLFVGNTLPTSQLDVLDRISHAERQEEASRSVLVLMGLLSLVALSGILYCVVLLPDFFRNPGQPVVRLFCALSLASVCSAFVCFGCWTSHRSRLNQLRAQSRREIISHLDTHRIPRPTLPDPMPTPPHQPRAWRAPNRMPLPAEPGDTLPLPPLPC